MIAAAWVAGPAILMGCGVPWWLAAVLPTLAFIALILARPIVRDCFDFLRDAWHHRRTIVKWTVIVVACHVVALPVMAIPLLWR